MSHNRKIRDGCRGVTKRREDDACFTRVEVTVSGRSWCSAEGGSAATVDRRVVTGSCGPPSPRCQLFPDAQLLWAGSFHDRDHFERSAVTTKRKTVANTTTPGTTWPLVLKNATRPIPNTKTTKSAVRPVLVVGHRFLVELTTDFVPARTSVGDRLRRESPVLVPARDEVSLVGVVARHEGRPVGGDVTLPGLERDRSVVRGSSVADSR